jgi:hypothetical protein
MGQEQPGISPQTSFASQTGAPYNQTDFAQMRVLDAWKKYDGVLAWGKGQCLAILDDGCKMEDPAWQATLPWGPKVIATWNSIDDNDNCHPVPPGYHGTSVGYPSSLNLNGVRGVAFNNHVAQVRSNTVVHLRQDESATIAKALRWVRDNHQRLNITVVNLAAVDDQHHKEPWPSAIDAELRALRELGIWVSSPTANHHWTDGISWPACQDDCFAIGGAKPGAHEIHLDRWSNVDLLVCAVATSSSNAYVCGCAQVLLEAIRHAGYRWQKHNDNLALAMMAIFQQTGVPIHDAATGLDFKELDLLAALDLVMQ